MARIHFVVSETAKTSYRDQARRDGKSLGQWLREAAAEKLAAARPAKFTLEELHEFNAACDARRSDAPEPDWDQAKRIIADSRVAGMGE